MTGARTMALAIISTSLGGLPVWLLAGLAPQIAADLGFGDIGLGAAIGVYFAISSVASLPAGRLVESIGWSRGVAVTAGLSAAAMFGVAVAARSWALLMVFLAIGALANSMSQPAANLGVAQLIPVRRQGIAFGIKQGSLPVTTFVVGLSLPGFTESGSWRWAFSGAASVALALCAVGWIAVPRERSSDGRRRIFGRGVQDNGFTRARVTGSMYPLVVLALAAAFSIAATTSLGGFLVVYGVGEGLTPARAGHLLALGSAVGVVSRLVTGYLADRRGRRHLPVVAEMILGGSVGLLVLAVGEHPWIILAGTLIAFGLGWSWNGLFAFAVVLNSRGAPALATGIVQTGMSAGAAAGPLAFGITATYFSYSVAWIGAAAAFACGAGLMVLGRAILRR